MKSHSRSLPLAILTILLPLIVSGCAGSQGKLSVDLSGLKECKRLGGPRPIPPIENYRRLAPAALAELNKANAADARRTKCEDMVIEKYKQANSS